MWQITFVGTHRNRPRRILQSKKSRPTLQAWSQVASRWAYDRSSVYRANLIAFVSKTLVDYLITNIRIDSCSNVYDRLVKAYLKTLLSTIWCYRSIQDCLQRRVLVQVP